jgi:rfaE bifunctional protein kinase chain/domain
VEGKVLAMRDERADIVERIRSLTTPEQRIVFVSGNFNVVHPGHLRLLKFARECGNFLVVGVNDQRPEQLAVPSKLRLEGIQAISFVDYAFLLREPPEVFIARLKPAVVVKGKEFDGRDNPEQAVVASYGGKLLFGSGEVRFSSLDLLRREYFEANLSSIRKPEDYPRRHGFSIAELKAHLARFSGMRVLVVGDLIVDEYVDCEPLGMSREDPTIVVTPIESRRFVGGAGIVAAHARGLGAEVDYVGLAGNDAVAAFAHEALERYGVRVTIVDDETRPTTLKQRYRAEGRTLLRVSHLRQHEAHPEIAAEIRAAVERRLPATDLLIFADFNYGCLPQQLVEALIESGRAHGVAMAADSQASSQVGDVSRFIGMHLITPTEHEARLALRDWSSGLAALADSLRRKAHAEHVVITLGPEGLLVHGPNGHNLDTDRLPAFNTAPRDPAGAGDSFLTCTAMALTAGVDIWQSAYLGSLAAACQIARVGNTPLTRSDLIAEIECL